jgi:hypothetical protein
MARSYAVIDDAAMLAKQNLICLAGMAAGWR